MEVKNHIEVNTSPQLKRLLSLQQNYSVFFNQIVAKIKGPLNKDTFIKSLNMVIDKYPILKMRYADGELMLDNNSGASITCHIHGWEQAGDAWADLIGKQLNDNRNDIINLEELSSEILLLQMSETSALIALSLPWYIADSYSLPIILRDLITQCLNGNEVASNKTTHFYQYADWQNSFLDEADEDAIQFWEHYNFDSYKTLRIPFEKNEPEGINAIYKYVVDDGVRSGLINLIEEFDISPAALLQSCLGVLLHKHSGAEDIVLGSVSNSRDLEQLKEVIGPLAKVLPLTIKINPEQQFSDLIRHTAESYDDILTWQDTFILPYEKGKREIIPFGFEYHRLHDQQYSGGTSTSIIQLCSNSDIFKARMVCLQTNRDLELNFYHNPKHLSLHSVQLLCTQFEALLKSVISNPNVLVKNINILSSLDLDLIHNQFNRPIRNNTIEEQSFIDLFELQVRKTPDFVAVKFDGNVISYADLNQRSNQLAHYMITECDINKGDVVGVMLDHSENVIIAALAILKCGAIFLPIDAGYPQERIKYLLSDASAKLLLTDSDWLLPITEIYSGQLFAMDIQLAELDEERENPAVTRGNDDPAYIIYTSGSTGKPKGVVVANESFVNYIIYANRYYFNNQAGYPFALFTSLSFDLTVTSIFSTLLRGDTVCCSPVKDIATTLIDIFDNESEVKAVKMTPSHVSILKGVGVKATRVEKVILGGEAVLCDHVSFLRSLNEKLQIYNEYGPTEATVGCTVKELKETDEHLTIGKPIDNARIYVVDEMLKCQPIGVMGELCIGGKVLAKGYLGREDLTHEKFVANPFDTESNQLLYRTGDLARWTADGELEYLGRQDDQVKLNGFRIEIGEIENVLMSIKGIDQAVVMLNEKQEQPILVGYYSGGESPSTSEIRSNLERKLPVYMIPAHFVHMNRWPLTVNGKVDRKSLSAYGPVTDLSSTDIKSGNEYEKRIISAWQKILGKIPDSLDENFFRTGGHSLNGIQLVSQLYKDYGFHIELRDLFDHPTVRGLAEVISGGEKSDYQEIQPVPEQEYYDVSHGQKRIWLLYQMEEEQIAYNMPHAFSLRGPVDGQVLRSSLNMLVDRHESLRTTFKLVDGEVKQYIHGSVEFDLEEYDWRGEEDRDTRVRALIESEATRVFDLEYGPLIIGRLVQLEDEHYVFTLTLHHIISDGWSNELLINELITIYSALGQGGAVPLEPLRIHYKDYALWQHEQLHGENYEKHEQYWHDQFSGEIPVLELPVDRVRPPVQTHHGASCGIHLASDITRGLRQLSEQTGSSMFMCLLASVKAFLYRYTGQRDMVIGTPVAGRIHPCLEDQVGFYINTLAIRTQFEGGTGFEELLYKVKENVLSAFEHQVYPFDKLVDSLSLNRDMSRSPLFDVMVILQNAHTGQQSRTMEGVVVEELLPESESSKFDITFNYNEIKDGEELYLTLVYNPDLFDASRIERMLEHYKAILSALTRDSHARLDELTFISEDERHQLLEVFNDTTATYPEEKTIHQLIEEQVLKRAEKTAVIYEDGSLTYEELNSKSNRLAHLLSEEYGVVSDDLVGLMVSRNEEMVVSMLAILKSGAAYVPIDPDYPQERINHIIKDSGIKLLITEESLLERVGFDGEVIIPDQLEDVLSDYSEANVSATTGPQDLAYVIYTSGSTGWPKGVGLTHGNAVAFISWAQEEFSTSPFDIVYAGTSYCFDLSVYEIFYTLSVGKTLRVIASGMEIPHYLERDNNVLINTVPSVVMELMKNEIDLSSVTVLNMAGEPVPSRVLSMLDCDRMEVRNLYGPSEDTTYSSCYRIKSGDKLIPIGRPVSNTRFYIVDEAMNLVPAGNPGEICISGAGLARGYLNNEVLTLERFVANPFEAGTRLYKTGDIGRWLPEGTVEFLGRKDNQVKVRGYRIELGEITSHLSAHDQVDEAVAVVRQDKDNNAYIVAYYTGSEALSSGELKQFLSSLMPMYMVPGYYVHLNKFPLTATGKIDRKALPSPKVTDGDAAYVAPATELEAGMARIWQELLNVERVGIDDDFFALGGHSLKATNLTSLIFERLNMKISIKDIFKHPTIRKLTKHISKERDQNEFASMK